MKIGKETIPRTSISTSNEHAIVVRGKDLCGELIGKISFTEYFYFLLTGNAPDPVATKVIDATLVAITEHGLVPSVQASRMTFAAAPDALQGAVAAGILGCGSVILGASETAGHLFLEVKALVDQGSAVGQAAETVLTQYRQQKRAIPGYGHPLHKERDPRVQALLSTAITAGADPTYIHIAEALEGAVATVLGKALKMNVSAAIPAVLLGVGFPVGSLKGIPILARTAGLIAHLREEAERSIGFALSYQATTELIYEGDVPAGFVPSDGL